MQEALLKLKATKKAALVNLNLARGLKEQVNINQSRYIEELKAAGVENVNQLGDFDTNFRNRAKELIENERLIAGNVQVPTENEVMTRAYTLYERALGAINDQVNTRKQEVVDNVAQLEANIGKLSDVIAEMKAIEKDKSKGYTKLYKLFKEAEGLSYIRP